MANEIETSLVQKFVENEQSIQKIQNQISQAIAGFETELKQKQAAQNELKVVLKNAMKEKGVKKFENDFVSLTYVAPTTRVSIDTAKLKEERPELWEEYSKETEVSDSIRIKVK